MVNQKIFSDKHRRGYDIADGNMGDTGTAYSVCISCIDQSISVDEDSVTRVG